MHSLLTKTSLNGTSQFVAQQIQANLYMMKLVVLVFKITFIWALSDFEGGIYHGRISLPPEYPLKPPSIMLLTVNILLLHNLQTFPQY